MRKLSGIFIAALLLSPHVSWGQTSRRSSKSTATYPNSPLPTPMDYGKLKSQAEEINQAFVRKDFGRVADMTFPKLVEILGGRARLIAFLEQSVRSMEAEGFAIISVSVGEPSDVLNDGKQLFAIVPTTMKIKVSEGILVAQAFRIANSKNGGENWTFVDGSSGLDKQKLKVLFPTVADRFRLPESKPPVLQREP